MVTWQYGEGCLKSFIMNSFLKIRHLNGTSSIFVGLSSFSVARKPLFVTSCLLSCDGSLWHCPLQFPFKTSPLWFGHPLDFFRSASARTSWIIRRLIKPTQWPHGIPQMPPWHPGTPKQVSWPHWTLKFTSTALQIIRKLIKCCCWSYGTSYPSPWTPWDPVGLPFDPLGKFMH